MRDRLAKGASLEEIAAEFSCSWNTTRKICSNVLPRTWANTRPKEPKPDKPVRTRIRWAPEIIGGVNPGGFRWTAEEDKRLFDMLQEGCTLREIADKLDRSYASVKDKVGRLSRSGEPKRVEGVATWRPKPSNPDLEHDEMLMAIQKEKPANNRVKCLKCLGTFDSYDPRRNRICVRCKGNEDWK
jgi:DNA-binding CsgD family transcriptional regulator